MVSGWMSVDPLVEQTENQIPRRLSVLSIKLWLVLGLLEPSQNTALRTCVRVLSIVRSTVLVYPDFEQWHPNPHL